MKPGFTKPWTGRFFEPKKPTGIPVKPTDVPIEGY
jgi:hypothetical protein